MIMDSEVSRFFEERKAAWLKKNCKASMDEAALKEKEGECEAVFSREQWLPHAAKRAGQISISTHPCTFSHPSSRKNKNGYATSIIANSTPAMDGFLRSGNVQVERDALGNAAALDVYKFLTLIMDDGDSLLSHIQRDSSLAKDLLTIESEPYDSLKAGFLAMVESHEENVTSAKIKQVYFPVDEGYHLLSILTPSGIVFDLRKRIDVIRFSEEAKAARKAKNNSQYAADYKELYGLTTMGYGGTKPQNISVLNNQNGGKAHVFLSAPPTIKKRDIHFPTQDFFQQSLNPYRFKALYKALHRLFTTEKNNIHVRDERDAYYQAIVDGIIETAWALRVVEPLQYHPESSRLPACQYIWLCKEREAKYDEDEVWLDKVVKDITGFITTGYQKVFAKKAIMLGDAEDQYVEKLVNANREALK